MSSGLEGCRSLSHAIVTRRHVGHSPKLTGRRWNYHFKQRSLGISANADTALSQLSGWPVHSNWKDASLTFRR